MVKAVRVNKETVNGTVYFPIRLVTGSINGSNCLGEQMLTNIDQQEYTDCRGIRKKTSPAIRIGRQLALFLLHFTTGDIIWPLDHWNLLYRRIPRIMRRCDFISAKGTLRPGYSD